MKVTRCPRKSRYHVHLASLEASVTRLRNGGRTANTLRASQAGAVTRLRLYAVRFPIRKRRMRNLST